MASLNGLYNVDDKPSDRLEPIPSGEYKAVIVSSESKPTKVGDGEYIEFEHQIIEGDHAGRKLFARLNLHNKNAKAVEIARAYLAQIRLATGKLNPQDTMELHNIPIMIRVVYLPADPSKNREQPQNEIKGWKPLAGAAGQANRQQAPYSPPANQAPSAPAQAAKTAKLPWQQ